MNKSLAALVVVASVLPASASAGGDESALGLIPLAIIGLAFILLIAALIREIYRALRRRASSGRKEIR